jgi:RecA-family ATPase
MDAEQTLTPSGITAETPDRLREALSWMSSSDDLYPHLAAVIEVWDHLRELDAATIENFFETTEMMLIALKRRVN